MRKVQQIFSQKIQLPFKIKKSILALGSNTKNSLCFAQGNAAYLSRPLQDLTQWQDFLDFTHSVKYFLKKHPRIIAYDLHPEYQSTKYVQNLPPTTYDLQPIQHHHAHIASCMAENGLQNQKVIGVAFDGTGLGPDQAFWGGEFLFCDYKNYQRRAYLKEIPLLGGEKAILEPWRLSAAWLEETYKKYFFNLKIDFVRKISQTKWGILKQMHLKGVNSPLSSSAGRLFDAVASLILAKDKAHFEAELACALEKIAAGYKSQASSYKFKIVKQGQEHIIDPAPMFREIVRDLENKKPRAMIALRFHLAVAEMVRKGCLILSRESKIKRVVLSGGVFQNRLLMALTRQRLSEEHFQVLTHQQLPCSDASLALGQAAVANFRG